MGTPRKEGSWFDVLAEDAQSWGVVPAAGAATESAATESAARPAADDESESEWMSSLCRVVRQTPQQVESDDEWATQLCRDRVSSSSCAGGAGAAIGSVGANSNVASVISTADADAVSVVADAASVPNAVLDTVSAVADVVSIPTTVLDSDSVVADAVSISNNVLDADSIVAAPIPNTVADAVSAVLALSTPTPRGHAPTASMRLFAEAIDEAHGDNRFDLA